MNLFKIVVGLESATVGPIDAKSVLADVARTFPGFSVTETRGFWEGNAEKSLTFEIASDFTLEWMKRFGQGLAFLHGQESVLVIQLSAEIYFVTPSEHAGDLVRPAD